MLTAIIWGAAFVAQDVGMDYLEPFTFNGIRCIIGAVVLLPVIAVRSAGKKNRAQSEQTAEEKKKALRIQLAGGLLTGVALFIPSSFQQFGIVQTTAGKAGFVTALYIVIVPIMGLFLKKKASLAVWAACVIACVGLYLLCVTERFTVGTGDILVFVGSIFWAVQILVVDYYAPRVDCLKLACAEFFVCGVLSLIGMLLFESPDISSVLSCAVPLLYAGVMSCGVAFTLQMIGQKYAAPAIASIMMSLESVFAAVFGFLLSGERLSTRELCGCALMFLAVLLAQIPARRKRADA